MPPRILIAVCITGVIALAAVMALRQGVHLPAPAPADSAAPLAAYRGRTLVLLMGMPGCPGTEEATAFFTGYATRKPAQVELLRIDVPPPEGKLDPGMPWSAPFPRQLDTDRRIAGALGFFSYPTLYVIDRDGTVRFSGPCETAKVETMVAEIAAEAPGSPKRMFSPAMPEVGTRAPAFSGTTLDGREVALDGLRGRRATLLLFGSTTCPFSTAAARALPELAAAYADQGLAVAIVNQGGTVEAMRAAYAGQTLPVVIDADAAISSGKYGVWAVPFSFVLDADGSVVSRQAYSAAAGKAAVAKALGLAHEVVLPNAGAG